MQPSDIQLLRAMEEKLLAFNSDNKQVGILADQLLALRDRLQFKSESWFRELNHHIATLDSASTFTPSNEQETRKLNTAIVTAVGGIQKLIETIIDETK